MLLNLGVLTDTKSSTLPQWMRLVLSYHLPRAEVSSNQTIWVCTRWSPKCGDGLQSVPPESLPVYLRWKVRRRAGIFNAAWLSFVSRVSDRSLFIQADRKTTGNSRAQKQSLSIHSILISLQIQSAGGIDRLTLQNGPAHYISSFI
jgi:hypothetical protein